MKRIWSLLFLILFSCVCLSACSSESMYTQHQYDEAYEQGYFDGMQDAEADSWYSVDAPDEAAYTEEQIKDSFGWMMDDAHSHAIDFGGLHPEEAWGIIEDYHNGSTEFFEDPPTEEEYKEAVNSMIGFYEYFYSGDARDFLLDSIAES